MKLIFVWPYLCVYVCVKKDLSASKLHHPIVVCVMNILKHLLTNFILAKGNRFRWIQMKFHICSWCIKQGWMKIKTKQWSFIPETLLFLSNIIWVLIALTTRFYTASIACCARCKGIIFSLTLAILQATRVPTYAHFQKTCAWCPNTRHFAASWRFRWWKLTQCCLQVGYWGACKRNQTSFNTEKLAIKYWCDA